MSTRSPEPLAVRSAIVVALPVPGAAPEDRLAGLSLALRTVLTLQKVGVDRVWLLADADAEVGLSVQRDPRTRLDLSVLPCRDLDEGLRVVAEHAPPEVLVAFSHVVVDPRVYQGLAEGALGDARARYAVRDGRRLGPLVASRDWLRDPRDLGTETYDVGAAWFAQVDTPAGRDKAFFELFEACRKPVDGVVAKNFNRHASIAISKRLVDTPITPNMMSVVTFLLGVAGAMCAARGGYGPTLAGAILMQTNSILDGVDGELARVRFQHSKLGQWLDTVSDDVSNWLFYGGLAHGARGLPHGRFLAACGWLSVGTGVLATAQYYAELVRVGSGDLYAIQWDFDGAPPEGLRGKALAFSRVVIKKDFALAFFLAMAAVGALPYMLPIVAAGSIGNLAAATLRTLRGRGASAPGVSRSP